MGQSPERTKWSNALAKVVYHHQTNSKHEDFEVLCLKQEPLV